MKTAKKIAALLLAIAMVLCLVACGGESVSSEKDALQRIVESGKIVVGIEAAHPPISNTDPATGEISGLSVDLINLYAQKLGVEVEFKQVEWAALIPGLTSGDTDVVADSLTRTVPRSASLNLSNPFFLTGTTALLRADEENLKTWEDLNSPDVKLSITEGTVYADTCAELFPEAEILTFQSKTEWSEALKAGRIDCVVEEECTLLDRMEVYPGDFKLFPDDYLATETYGFAVQYGETGLQYSLNMFLQEIMISGEYAALYEKWTGQPWVPGNFGI